MSKDTLDSKQRPSDAPSDVFLKYRYSYAYIYIYTGLRSIFFSGLGVRWVRVRDASFERRRVGSANKTLEPKTAKTQKP